MRTRSMLRAAALAAAVLASCGEVPDAPRTQPLAAGFVPSVEPTALTLPRGLRLLPAPDEPDAAWVETALPAAAWQQVGPSVWRAPRAFAGVGHPADGPAQELVGEAGAYRYVARAPEEVTDLPGAFCATGSEIVVLRPADAGPPGDLRLREFVRTSRSDGERRRVELGPLLADGIPLVPGTTETLDVRVPPASALTLWTSAFGGAAVRAGSDVTFTVRAGGELLLRHEQQLLAGLTIEAHTVPLPAEGGALRFELRVDGPPSLAALHVPVVHPLDVGTRDARPWEERRPDLVLFQADTFRADNLAAYGGPAGLTPNLDAFAEQALTFTSARSNASWTVPAHASLFTGLLPHQAACTGPEDRLPAEVTTLAEHLRAQGYRTVAITDQGFVSRAQGFAQGFEWFFELGRRGEGSLAGTLRDVRTQLAVDDGRPLFLFVQTYRAHVPYAVSEETRALLGPKLGIEGTWEELARTVPINTIRAGDEGFEDFVAAAEALYRGGAHDVDRGFGQFVDILADAGLDDAWVCVFSDHGEAFGEGGHWGHGTNVHDSQLRVPLLLRGPGLEAGVVDAGVSLVDLPPTLLRLAGVEPPRDWHGRSLLAEQHGQRAAERWVTSVQGDAAGAEGGGALARTRGARKLLVHRVDRPEGVVGFALDADPDERAPLRTGDAAWIEEATQELLHALPTTLAPRFEAARTARSADAQRDLEALGYGGG